jgi:hypothetical protein
MAHIVDPSGQRRRERAFGGGEGDAIILLGVAQGRPIRWQLVDVSAGRIIAWKRTASRGDCWPSSTCAAWARLMPAVRAAWRWIRRGTRVGLACTSALPEALPSAVLLCRTSISGSIAGQPEALLRTLRRGRTILEQSSHQLRQSGSRSRRP